MKLIRKNLKWITLVVAMLIITAGITIKYFLLKEPVVQLSENNVEIEFNEPNDINEEIVNEKVKDISEQRLVYVDVKGAVKKPGVYEISEDKKVIDVVNLAGGFTKDADTSMINLAKKVSDAMVIIIYTKTEVKNASQKETVVKVIEKECICPEITNDACINQNKNETEETIKNDKKININTATLEELLTLTGIGESKAQAIIAYRDKNGNFEKIEELMNVSGIGESLYEKIKENITV